MLYAGPARTVTPLPATDTSARSSTTNTKYQQTDRLRPNHCVDIRTRTDVDNDVVPDILGNIMRGFDWGAKDKIQLSIGDDNAMYIFVNRFCSKIIELKQHIHVKLPLASKLSKIHKIDFSKNQNRSKKEAPILFDIGGEEQTNLWWFAHKDDLESVCRRNSMNHILKNARLGKQPLKLFKCTGVGRCSACVKDVYHRMPRKNTARSVVAPSCKSGHPAVTLEHLECNYHLLVWENENFTKNGDFNVVVARFGTHTAHCKTLSMRATPSAEMFLMRNHHPQSTARAQHISARSFSNDNAKDFGICHIDPHYTKRRNINRTLAKQKRQRKIEQGFGSKWADFEDWKVFRGGVPEYLSSRVYLAELSQGDEDLGNQLFVMSHPYLIKMFARELNNKNVHEVFINVDSFERLLESDRSVMATELPLHAFADATHKKCDGAIVVDFGAFFELPMKAITFLYMLCEHEQLEAFVGLFGVLLSEIQKLDDAPPMGVMLRSFLTYVDLDATAEGGFFLAVYLLANEMWTTVVEKGIVAWCASLPHKQSLQWQNEAKALCQTFSIQTPIVRDRLHATGVFRKLANLLPVNLRSLFIQEGWALTQMRTVDEAIKALASFLKRWMAYSKIRGKLSALFESYIVKRILNVFKQKEVDKILRCLVHDHNLDVEHNHQRLNELRCGKLVTIYDFSGLIKGHLEHYVEEYFSEHHCSAQQPDRPMIEFQRMKARREKVAQMSRATSSSFLKGRIDKFEGRRHRFKKGWLTSIDLSLLAGVKKAKGKSTLIQCWLAPAHQHRVVNVLFPGPRSGSFSDIYESSLLKLILTATNWRDNEPSMKRIAAACATKLANANKDLNLARPRELLDFVNSARATATLKALKSEFFFDDIDAGECMKAIVELKPMQHQKLRAKLTAQGVMLDLDFFSRLFTELKYHTVNETLKAFISNANASHLYVISRFKDQTYLCSLSNIAGTFVFEWCHCGFTVETVKKVHFGNIAKLSFYVASALFFAEGSCVSGQSINSVLMELCDTWQSMELDSDCFRRTLLEHTSPTQLRRIFETESLSMQQIGAAIASFDQQKKSILREVAGQSITTRMKRLRKKSLSKMSLLEPFKSTFVRFDALRLQNRGVVFAASDGSYKDYKSVCKDVLDWAQRECNLVMDEALNMGARRLGMVQSAQLPASNNTKASDKLMEDIRTLQQKLLNESIDVMDSCVDHAVDRPTLSEQPVLKVFEAIDVCEMSLATFKFCARAIENVQHHIMNPSSALPVMDCICAFRSLSTGSGDNASRAGDVPCLGCGAEWHYRCLNRHHRDSQPLQIQSIFCGLCLNRLQFNFYADSRSHLQLTVRQIMSNLVKCQRYHASVWNAQTPVAFGLCGFDALRSSVWGTLIAALYQIKPLVHVLKTYYCEHNEQALSYIFGTLFNVCAKKNHLYVTPYLKSITAALRDIHSVDLKQFVAADADTLSILIKVLVKEINEYCTPKMRWTRVDDASDITNTGLDFVVVEQRDFDAMVHRVDTLTCKFFFRDATVYVFSDSDELFVIDGPLINKSNLSDVDHLPGDVVVFLASTLPSVTEYRKRFCVKRSRKSWRNSSRSGSQDDMAVQPVEPVEPAEPAELAELAEPPTKRTKYAYVYDATKFNNQ